MFDQVLEIAPELVEHEGKAQRLPLARYGTDATAEAVGCGSNTRAAVEPADQSRLVGE